MIFQKLSHMLRFIKGRQQLTRIWFAHTTMSLSLDVLVAWAVYSVVAIAPFGAVDTSTSGSVILSTNDSTIATGQSRSGS